MDSTQKLSIKEPLWPEEFACRYRTKGYWAGEDLSAPLRRFAMESPETCALISHDGQKISYAQLDAAADEAAVALRAWGLCPGDRMVLQLPNTPELMILFFGCIRAQVVPVMVLPSHRIREVLHLARGSGAVAYAFPDCIATFDYRDLARELCEELPQLHKLMVLGDPGDLSAASAYKDVMALATPLDDNAPAAGSAINPGAVALLLHSGGTSGLPKLIPRTHDDYLYNARASAEVCGLDVQSVYLACLAAEHNFPLACPGILGTFCVGGTVVLARDPSPGSVFALIERYGVTITAAVPTLVGLWLEAREFDESDLSSLEVLQVGGSKLARSVAARIPDVLGARVQQVFGMAEGLLNFTRPEDSGELTEISQGRPLSPDDELRIVDEEGCEVPDGAVGELWVRGPYTIRQYIGSPEVNARAFTADGFYRSGDMVRRLPSGHLVVEGRAGDQINRGGEKFSAAEIEGYLIDHPAIREVVVIGVPDPDLGQAACAVITLSGKGDLTLRDLRVFLMERGVATYKLPDRLEVVQAVPLTRFGKIDRKAILARITIPEPT